ncbi:maestro heat-like repeat-containing protein family member 2A [Sceloporus undulatus]|uniref:maestro heat-like repeat-containing protein family member 2A n=1 Tax=Sceloporus undulatus TaxID=8520 RepID=UPI001C4ABB79|nr:maestro heat-like repeat-containing protein family member 2A [Sceloporus undulatus]
MTALTATIHQDEVSAWQKVAVYRCLQALLNHGLKVGPTCRFFAVTSGHLRMPLLGEEGPRRFQAAASNTLARLARHHFNPVMTELQHYLKPFVQPDEFTLLTLGKIAATNVFSCIPFLGITLTTLQTVTRWMEDGQRRQALCKALKQMCQAIRIYLRKWERISYPRISVQQFSTYLFPLYACIARTWLPERDPLVKLAVLKALRPMLSILLPRTDFQMEIHQDILLLAAQGESSVEPFLVTQILAQILEASLVNSNPIPRTHVEPLACTLTRQISSGDHQHPPRWHRQENCAEISHIFLQLARLHPSELLRVFQKKLEEGQEGVRLVVLRSLSEIVGAQFPELWSRRMLCVKVVKVVLADNETQVRLATLQVIGQLLRAGYLEKVEGWSLNYISLQLAMSAHRLMHPTQKLPLGGLEEKAMERVGTEALHVAVASGRQGSQELWVRLLDYVLQPHYTGVATPLCHSLTLLAEQRWRKVLQSPDGLEAGNVPTPQELMARLLSLAVSPLEGSGRGSAALLLLNALRPEMFKDVAENWWVEVPIMVRYLEGRTKYTLPLSAWEKKLLEFLKKSIQQKRSGRIEEEEEEKEDGCWNLVLAKELSRQRQLWPGSSTEQAFLCKATGVALAAARDAEGVTGHLLDLLLHTDYTNEGQQKGMGWCLAYCAEGHLAEVLEALGRFEAEISEEEDSTCRLCGQGLPQPEKSGVKSALLGLYGSAISHAPREQLLPPLLGRIVGRMLHHYLTAGGLERAKGDTGLALSFARSVSEVSLAIQGLGDVQMPQKRDLLDHLVALLKAQPLDHLDSPICQETMVALRHLSRVPEALSPEENLRLAELCLGHLFALPPSGLVEDASQALYRGALRALSDLVETLLDDREVSGWLQQVLQLLGYCLASEREWERARSVQLGTHLLRARRQKTKTLPQAQWGSFSLLVGALVPLTYDTLGTIRQGVSDCIGILLSLQGATLPQKLKSEGWRLRCIRQDIYRKSTKRIQAASRQLAKVVSWSLPPEEILPFLRVLMEQLGAISAHCDQATLLWFEVAVTEREMDLEDKICNLVSVICSQLQHSEEPNLRQGLACAVCVLAEHHCKATCATLLEQALLPLRTRKKLWTALATYKDLSVPVLKLLFSWLKAGKGRKRGGGGEEEVHVPDCVPVLVALQDVVLALDSCTGLFSLLSALCCTLLWQLSQEEGDEMPTAETSSVSEENRQHRAGPLELRGLSVGVLQAVFSKASPEATVDLGGTWTVLMKPGYSLKGAALLGRAFLTCPEDPFLDGLLRRLLPSLRSSRAASKDLSLAFCTELSGLLLHRRPETLPLLLQGWLARAKDGGPSMRSVSVRGLGNVVETTPQEAKQHQESLLATLLQAAGDPTSPEVAREGLDALRKVVASGCFGKHSRHMLQAMASQAQEHFWHMNGDLRTAAFQLLGQLAVVVTPKHTTSFAKVVVRGSLAALLVHLKDSNLVVAMACWGALGACAPFVGLQDLLADMHAWLLLMDVSGAYHSRLMERVCRHLALTDPGLLETILAEVPQSLSCAWEEIQLAACKLAGILMETMDTLRLGRLDLEPLLQALQTLAQQDSSDAAVKTAASDAAAVVRQKWQERQAQGCQWRALPGWFFRRQRKGNHGRRRAP